MSPHFALTYRADRPVSIPAGTTAAAARFAEFLGGSFPTLEAPQIAPILKVDDRARSLAAATQMMFGHDLKLPSGYLESKVWVEYHTKAAVIDFIRSSYFAAVQLWHEVGNLDERRFPKLKEAIGTLSNESERSLGSILQLAPLINRGLFEGIRDLYFNQFMEELPSDAHSLKLRESAQVVLDLENARYLLARIFYGDLIAVSKIPNDDTARAMFKFDARRYGANCESGGESGFATGGAPSRFSNGSFSEAGFDLRNGNLGRVRMHSFFILPNGGRGGPIRENISGPVLPADLAFHPCPRIDSTTGEVDDLRLNCSEKRVAILVESFVRADHPNQCVLPTVTEGALAVRPGYAAELIVTPRKGKFGDQAEVQGCYMDSTIVSEDWFRHGCMNTLGETNLSTLIACANRRAKQNGSRVIDLNVKGLISNEDVSAPNSESDLQRWANDLLALGCFLEATIERPDGVVEKFTREVRRSPVYSSLNFVSQRDEPPDPPGVLHGADYSN